MKKLTKTTLYLYYLKQSCSFKKQVGTYTCQIIGDNKDEIVYQDANGIEFVLPRENLNLTTFLGSDDSKISFIFENVNENDTMEEVEKIISEDASSFFQSIADFLKKE